MSLLTCLAYEVEFIGGPEDGRVRRIDGELTPFVGIRIAESIDSKSIYVLVRSWIRRLRHRKDRIAIYQFGRRVGQLQYRYVGTQMIGSGALSDSHCLTTLDQVVYD